MENLQAVPDHPDEPVHIASGSIQSDEAQDGKPAGFLLERTNLTSLQTLYWVAERLRPDIPLLSTVMVFHIAGPVELDVFQSAFQALLERSDALRTVFSENEGIPLQHILPVLDFELQFVDFSHLTNPEDAWQQWLTARIRLPLAIDTRSFDSALVKLSDGRFVWYLNQHHLTSDASSFFRVFDYLASYYEHFLNDGKGDLPGIPALAKYVEYERKLHTSPKRLKARAFWDRKLKGKETVTFFGKTSAKRTSRSERITLDLGPARSEKLRALARKGGLYAVSEEFSLYNIFAGLFTALLHQVSGLSHPGFVTPVHNRFSEHLRNTVGLVMELCPLQVEIDEQESFAALIRKMRAESRELMAYYQYGSEYILEAGFYDVMFNMHPMPALQMAGMPVVPERIHTGYGTESLALHVLESAGSGSFILHFYLHTDVFDAQQRSQMLRAYETLLDACLQDEDQPIPVLIEAQPGHALEFQKVINQASDKFVAPRDELERQLTEIWRDVLEVPKVGIRDNFFELGGDSWHAVRLFYSIEEVLGRKLPISSLIGTATVEALAEMLRRDPASLSWSYVKMIQPGSKARRPFFGVPGAGNSVMVFRNLASYIGTDQPFYAFQLKGVNGEEDNFATVEEMAEAYLQAMRQTQPEGPYRLGGYSFGGMIAFEIAQQLLAQSQQVACLAIIDTPAQNPNFRYLYRFIWRYGDTLHWDTEKKRAFFLGVRRLIFRARYYLHKSLREKHGRSPQMSTQRNNPDQKPVPSTEEVNHFKKNFGTNIRLFNLYIPRPYPGMITLFRSQGGYQNPNLDYSFDPYLGWRKVARGGIEVFEIPGNHNQMIREPHVKLLGQILRSTLEKA